MKVYFCVALYLMLAKAAIIPKDKILTSSHIQSVSKDPSDQQNSKEVLILVTDGNLEQIRNTAMESDASALSEPAVNNSIKEASNEEISPSVEHVSEHNYVGPLSEEKAAPQSSVLLIAENIEESKAAEFAGQKDYNAVTPKEQLVLYNKPNLQSQIDTLLYMPLSESTITGQSNFEPSELLDTAEGGLIVPFFKKSHKARRRIALSRLHHRRPLRRISYYVPLHQYRRLNRSRYRSSLNC